ncbi:hypothetical protein [Fluviispira multicolorata]|uniref:Uncharacterized protein n=1 Tax=Fluviispira multicolorata TaxID=2654512 RepID=A0A833JE21_9BACT|nr:hypothetical protein [Fluviispira multicolorata]KAB8032173.1 hypothetical protein GCL57_05880 [Fluviispira multicolorata]
MLKKLVLVSSVLCTFNVFASNSSVLELLLNGTITQTPFWSTDGGVSVAKQVIYSYNGYVPANGVIDTNIVGVSLVHPVSASSNVELSLPSNCTIGGPGGTAVSVNDTQFVVNNNTYANNATIGVAEFPDTGSYGATSIRISGLSQNVQGALSCPANGSLTYIY